MATASPAASTAHAGGPHLRRDVSRIGLLFTGVGSIIGSGWLFGAFNASTHAGPSAIISWAIGGVMIMLIALVYAELGAMYPISGGVVRFPSFTHGGLTSYSVGWITWLAAMSVAPIEVEGALQYATNYWPHFTHVVSGVPVLTGYGYAAAALLMLLFSLINVIGVGLFSRINTPIVWWKLGIIVLVIASFMASAWHGSNFTSHSFFTHGTHGMFEAVAVSGIVFSYLGFRQGVELAGESRNPQKTVPLAVLGSVAITMVIYIALQAAFILALPQHLLASGGWDKLSFTNDFGPLAGISGLIGLTWLSYLLYADAFISPADTGLIYTTVTARISYAMGRNRTAPLSLAKLNSRGVPYISVVVTFFAGLVIFAPFPSWQKLVGFITSATVLSFASGPIVLSSLRRDIPHEHRPFRLPAADVIAFLAFFSSNMIVYWSGWDIDWKLFGAIGIGFVIYGVWRALTFRTTEHAPLNLRPFLWVPFWLGGLVAISWVGSYPDQSAHAGNLGDLSFATAWGVIGGFSLIIFMFGVWLRLPADAIIANIATMKTDEPAALTYDGAEEGSRAGAGGETELHYPTEPSSVNPQSDVNRRHRRR